MNHRELLNDFVDGLLDYQGEAALFAELNADEGLREELKSLILMRDAVHHDMRAFMPTVESTGEIFRRIGFGAVAGSAARTAGGWAYSLIGAAVGAALTAALFLMGPLDNRQMAMPSEITAEATGNVSEVRPDGRADGRADAHRHEKNMTAQQTAPPYDNRSERTVAGRNANDAASHTGPPRGSGTTEQVPAGFERRERPARVVNHLVNEGDGGNTAVREPMPPVEAVELRSHTDESLPRSIAIPEEERLPDTFRQIIPQTEATSLPTGKPLPFALEYRSVVGSSFDRLPAELEENSKILTANSALAFTYVLNDYEEAAVEVGWESYYQRFETRTTTGDLVLLEQNPMLFWGGASFRQYLHRSPGLNPYVQGTIGITRLGPLGRLRLGAHYEVNPWLRFFAGGELNAAAFQHDGTWFLSPRYNATYGVAVGF